MNNNGLDSVGPNDGTLSGVTFGTPGHPPGSTHFGLFDGVNNEINCGNDSSLAFTDTMSAVLWYYSTNGSGKGLFYKGLDNQNGDYALKTNPAGRIDVVLNDALRLRSDVADTLIQNSWNHIGYTFDKNAGANNLILYHNGVPIKAVTFASSIQVSADNFRIGRYFSQSFSFKGRQDQLALGSVVLSPADFLNIYNSGVGIDILAGVEAGRRNRVLKGNC